MSYTANAIRTASIFAGMLAWAATAASQPVTQTIYSVEWLAANSRRIVRAKIDDVQVHDPESNPHSHRTLSLRILETLKGEHSERLQVVHSHGYLNSARVSELQQNGQELLLFLNHWRDSYYIMSSKDYALTRFPFIISHAAILTPKDIRFGHPSLPPMTSSQTELATPQALIESIKDYLNKYRDERPLYNGSRRLPGHAWTFFCFPVHVDVGKRRLYESKFAPRFLDFATFKEKYSKDWPIKKKQPYTRKRGQYLQVYALEHMAADSDAIYRGVIKESCFVSKSGDPTGHHCGFRMRVLETLKGKSSEHANIFVTDARNLRKLARRKQELIVFLRDNSKGLSEHPAGALHYRTRDDLWDDSVIVLNKNAEVLFADMTWHSESREILTRLRDVIHRDQHDNNYRNAPEVHRDITLVHNTTEQERAEEGIAAEQLFLNYPVRRPMSFSFRPPHSLVEGSSMAGNKYAILSVPLDQELEENARDWSTADNPDLRWLAARALLHFKSEENAAILETMLEDEAAWEIGEMIRMLDDPHKRGRPKYLVRWQAWHVLKGWGYDVPKPDFGENR